MVAKKKTRIDIAYDELRERYEQALMQCIQARMRRLLELRKGINRNEDEAKRIGTELDQLNKGSLIYDSFAPYTEEGVLSSKDVEDLCIFPNISDIGK